MDSLEPAHATYEQDLLARIREYAREGLSLVRKEPAYKSISPALMAMNGDYATLRSKALSQLSDNRIRKVAFDVASALTDVRPIWNYDTQRLEFREQSETLSRIPRYWWKKTSADRPLFSAILSALTGGSAYLLQQWNPDLPGGGDIELIPFAATDVLPIGPVFSESIQEWQGIILRRSTPIDALIDEFPAHASAIKASVGASWFPQESRSADTGSYLFTPSVIQRLSGPKANTLTQSSTIDEFLVFIKDYSTNTQSTPIVMGGESAFAYEVQPGKRLYPRGRFIRCVEQAILYDGPSSSWHRKFPVTRLTLLPLPWTLLGASWIADLLPLQNSLNEALRGLEDAVAQCIRRHVVGNFRTAENVLKKIDMREAGNKLKINAALGEKIDVIEGPQLPPYYMEFIRLLVDQIDDNSGSRGMKNLDKLAQMPAADTIERFMDALSPVLKVMARSVELTLSEIADLFLMNVFQHYTSRRRYQMLGKDGLSVDDFDYDPGTMVPAGVEGETREERAAAHKQNFIFSVEPNSFLTVSHQTKQLQVLQLFGRNGIDIWSAWKALDISGTGPMPAETIPERMFIARKLGLQPGPTPEVIAAQEELILLQTQQAKEAIFASGLQGMLQEGMKPGGPGGAPNAPPPAMAAPSNSGVGPQGGRPPSAQAPPRMLVKSDGQGGRRTVISESGS